MKIFDNIVGLQGYLDTQRKNAKTIGLVPTMGALHAGHLHLIKHSIEKSDLTVCSIFVNPTQFNNPDDLLKYPKQLEADQQLLEEEGCDAVFIPSVDEMYPTKAAMSLSMNFGFLETVLEGAFRPRHFSGVGVVVAKLLNIVQPHMAFFGQKDLQQLAVIKKLVNDLNIRTEIISVPTVREESGLAMSSRNQRLSESDATLAAALSAAMNELKQQVLEGSTIADALLEAKRNLSSREGIKLEYLDVVDSETMATVDDLTVADNISICIAAHIGGVRLIDNLYLKHKG